MPSDYHVKGEGFYRKLDIEPPSTVVHGQEEDIKAKLKPLMPNSWHLEGNQLIGETEMGRLVQTISVNKILTGTDEKGMPVFRTIDI